MMYFTDKTYANILSEQLARVSNTIDKREGSIVQTALGPASWYIEGLYLVLSQLQRNSSSKYAIGEYLDYKVAERGITRDAATVAKREGMFDVYVPLGARFSTIAGDASITFIVSGDRGIADGKYRSELTAEIAGVRGNGYVGAILPITFIQGLTFSEIGAIIIAGTDEENDDSLRQRYMDSLTEQPFAGNIAAYRNAILAADDVGAVQIYPVWRGGGTVLCSILDANYNSATPDLVSKIQYLICPPEVKGDNPSANGFGLAPIGAVATISTATPLYINTSVTVQISIGYSIEIIKPQIESAIEDYLLSVRRAWDTMVTTNQIVFPVFVYAARVNAAILAIDGVTNVSDIQLNGFKNDIALVQTSELQEIPMKGQVVVNVA